MPQFELSERERQALSQADRLNAIMANSSIPNGAAAAQQRSREQAAQRLQRGRDRREDSLASMELGMKYGSGRFQGTGMEAQMLNIWNDPSIPMDDPRKQQAKAYLSRQTTVALGDGRTIVRPGLLGGDEQVNRKPTDREIAAGAAVDLGDTNAEVTPGAGSVEANWWDSTVAQIPFLDERFYQSDAWKKQNTAAEAWTETYAKTVKGGGQVTDDDRKQVRETYWPTESDDAEQIAIKAEYRRNVEAQAAKTAGAAGSDASVEDLLKIY